MTPGLSSERWHWHGYLPALPIILSLLVPAASAGSANEVPSCYAANRLPAPTAPPPRALFVLLDQTTVFNARLRAQIVDNALRAMRPGGTFTVAGFSAFTRGHYTEVVARGVIEDPIPAAQRDDISERTLHVFDACLLGQSAFAQRLLTQKIRQIEADASPALSKSDIMAALENISASVRASNAREKVVLLASDMLENSSVSSFYRGSTVRRIDPESELKKAQAAGMLGDFGGAAVYVIGGGLLAADAHRAARYRDPRTMHALRRFWTLYFQRSHAHVAEFGQPALLGMVRGVGQHDVPKATSDGARDTTR